MPAQRHILIAGGGVIGLTTAYFLLQKGHRVTLVERGPRIHDCCSRHNAGMIVPSHFVPLAAPGAVSLALRWMWNPESPLYIKPRLDWDLITWGLRFMRCANAAHVARSAPLLRDLSLASRALFEEFAELPDNDFGLARRGLLMLCRTQHSLDEEARTAARSRELGIPAEVLDARQTAARDPDVTMSIAGSVYFPKDCHLAPDRFLDRMSQAVEKLGGELIWDTEILGWKTRGKHIEAVRTRSGERFADDYVLCGGSWSPTVAKDLGLRLPTQAGKGYSLTVAKPRELPKICAIFTEARIAITPIGSSLRFGGTMEIAGLNEDINPVRIRGIVKAVPSYYPKFKVEDFDGIQPWRGLRPVSPDGMPYLGRSARFENLGIATGHAMMGLSLAPITGKLMAQVMSNEKPEIDLASLSPDRFG
jgi:D-amino-acid dehydrogenase